MHNPFNYDFIDQAYGVMSLTLAFLRKLETKRRSALRGSTLLINKIGPIIEKFHKDDELIVCYLSRNNYAVKNLSDYLDNKDIVTALLINADSGSILDYFHQDTLATHLKIFLTKFHPFLKKIKTLPDMFLIRIFNYFIL